jgi:CARDB protein
MVRRTIAIGGAVIAFILIVLLFRGCLDARKERAMEDYVRNTNELLAQSQAESRRLFDILKTPSGQDQSVDRQNQANELRVDSATLVDRAHDLDVPDQLNTADGYFTESMELRRDALNVVAEELPGALAQEERRSSTARIAQMMQVFLASDVLLKSRYRPSLSDALDKEGVSATLPTPNQLTFVKDLNWLQPAFVADQIAGIRGTGGSATPGLHGNGLGAVSLGGVALTPGASATVQLTGDTAFDVQVANQGDSTETDVVVNVTVGQGADADKLEETLPEIAPGETKTVTIPLNGQPPTGQNVPIKVEVKPVPGEKVTDNNEADFTVIFTR